MTKKDFELIAKSVKRSAHEAAELELAATKQAISEAHEMLAYNLASELAKTNPKFDQLKFVTACGVEV